MPTVLDSVKNLKINDKISKNNITDICDLKWILSKQPFKSKSSKKKTLIDLYSGCGGMTLGVQEALRKNGYSLEIKLAVDTDKAALETYSLNFGVSDDVVKNVDISDFASNHIGTSLSKNERETQKKFSNIDILVAGPPCQGHSNLNNHTRRNDPRNNLYLNAIRFIEIVNPRIAIIENVSTVIHDKDQVVEKANLALGNKGYTIHSLIINSSQFGLAQERKRHFQIALLDSEVKIDLNPYKRQPSPLKSYIGDLINETVEKEGIFFTPSQTKSVNQKRIDYLFQHNIYDLPDSVRPDCHKTKQHSYKSCYGRMSWDKPAQTITSGFGSMGQGRYIHPKQKRVITPHEAARIQGFPDFYNFLNVKLRGDLHTMIANAVPPKLIAILICSILKK